MKTFARVHLPVSPQARIHDHHNFEKTLVETAVAWLLVRRSIGRGLFVLSNDSAGKTLSVGLKGCRHAPHGGLLVSVGLS
jgi:hypothetical protein